MPSLIRHRPRDHCRIDRPRCVGPGLRRPLSLDVPRLCRPISSINSTGSAIAANGHYAPFDPDQDERGIYVVEGEIDIAGETFEGPRLLIFRPGDLITVRATQRARLMFFGGSAMEGPRCIWWNFVSSRRERIEQAKEEWKSGRFKPVPGETEFIPLPEK